MIIPQIEPAFITWLALVEKEQECSGTLKNIIINRQCLYYLWQNGYTPLDALKDIDVGYQHAAA